MSENANVGSDPGPDPVPAAAGGATAASAAVAEAARPLPAGEAAQPSQSGNGELPQEEEQALTPELFAEETERGDFLLAFLVLALAFLLSAFKISDAPLWRHLATGQYILAQGLPQTDIFSYTAGERPWVNLNWLFDVATFQVWQLAGAGVLVLLKVATVCILTLLLLTIRHRGPTLWWTVCTVTALLVVLNGEFQVAPRLFTYVGLTAELALLHQVKSQRRTWMLWLCVPLQILWVNVDDRFYMGLLLLALFLLGEGLQRLVGRGAALETAMSGRALRTLGAALGLSLVGSLVNPYGLAALWEPILQHRDLYSGLRQFEVPSPLRPLMSVYSADYWEHRREMQWEERLTALLAVLALASFGLNWRRTSVSRLLVFTGFFVVGTLLVQNLYLLALVASVTLALNGQEWFLDRFGTEVRVDLGWLIWARGGRVVTVLGFVVLSIFGAAGRFRGSLGQDQWFGVDATLQDAFDTVRAQLADIPAGARGFNFDLLPHHANLVIATAFPEHRVFLDERLSLYRRGRARPEARTSVPLSALPATVVVPTSDGDQTLTESLAQPPINVFIPEKYQDRFWHDFAQKRLVLRGRLAPKEFEELLALADKDLQLRSGLDPSGTVSQRTRREYKQALRSLSARSRLAFDAAADRLSFRGPMSVDDYAALVALSREPVYRQAVDTLLDKTQDLLQTYLRLRQAIRNDEVEVWKPLFDKYQISYLTLYMPPSSSFYPRTFLALWHSDHWQAVRPLSGSLAVFVRKDVKDEAIVQYREGNRLDFQALAYHAPEKEPGPLEPAPSVEPRSWLYPDWLWRTRYVPSQELLEAWHYFMLGERLAPSLNDLGEKAAYSLLAIRRVRESLVDHPGNPLAYLLLGHCYDRLLFLEILLAPGSTMQESLRMHNLRYYQLIAALSQAITADPNLEVAHELLYQWYYQRGHWDLALRHLQELHRLVPPQDEEASKREQQLLLLEDRVETMRRDLERMQEKLTTPLARAQYALQGGSRQEGGFPLLALEQLGEFSPFGAQENGPLFVHLWLETGQHEKAVEFGVNPLEKMEVGVFPPGRWEELMGTVRLLQGNYALAAQSWEDALERKLYATAAELLHASGSLPQGLQLSGSAGGGLLQGAGLPIVDVAARLTHELPRERSTGLLLLGLANLETPFVNRAAPLLEQSLAVDPNNPLRPVVAYYLERLSGKKIDPVGPGSYLIPEFEAEAAE